MCIPHYSFCESVRIAKPFSGRKNPRFGLMPKKKLRSVGEVHPTLGTRASVFSRSCSLARLQPLQKRDSRVEQHDLSHPGGDQIRRIWPIFEVFPAARAPAAARDPRNRPTPAPGTRDGRPAPGAGASGARGVPAGRKGPIFSAPGVRVGHKCPKRRRRRAPACCWRRATAKMVPGVQLPGSRARSSPRQRQCRRRRRVL